MKSLDDIRQLVNETDEKIAALFEKRMDLAAQVIRYKMENNLPVFDPAREKDVLEKSRRLIKNKEYEAYYTELMQTLMDLSKKYQYKISGRNTVGYQGALGAFSHIASRNLFPQMELVSYESFEDVFRAVENDEVAYGVVPFENSYTGEVGEVIDLLKKYDCHITSVYRLPIRHHLLGLKNAKISDIKEVYSHHQAISQCQTFLKGGNFTVIPSSNTAVAAKFISESGDIRKAAIASKETAELYDLRILVEDINTSVDNTTKFIVITKDLEESGNRFSLLFTVDHNAGQLAKVIEIISKHKFNMENIKSRSLKDLPWEYYFYVEIVGSLRDEKTKRLIEEMRANSKGVKILGGYTV